MRRLALLLVALSLLVSASTALAHTGATLTFDHPKITCVSPGRARVNRRWNRHHRHHRVTRVCKQAKPTTAQVATYGPMSYGMGDVYQMGCNNLPLEGSQYVRIIVQYYDNPYRWIACAQQAQSAGYRILLDIQYGTCWSDQQDYAWFQQILGVYHPYMDDVYAVSVGNEQELRMSYGCGNSYTTPQLAQLYSDAWKTVEPLIPAGKLRVAGEISPWGYSFLQDAVADGLPGAQVYAAHVYPAGGSGAAVNPTVFAKFARQHNASPWATEGLCGPSAWVQYGCRSAQSLQQAGITMGVEWFDNSNDPKPAPAPSAFPTVLGENPGTVPAGT